MEDGEVGDWNWLRDNTCRRNKVEFGQGTYEDGICPDGVYKTGSDDTKVYCQGGECREIYMSGKCGDDSLTVVSSPKPVQLQGAAKCTDGTKEVACSDGMYVLDGYYYACKGGSCERCSSVSTVTSSSASTSATTEQGENETTETAESSSAQNNSDIDARVASILANEQKRREKAGSISDPEARKKLEEEDKEKYENYINNLQGQNESGSSSAQNNSDVDARVASILANEQKRREKAGSISDPEARKKLEEEDKAKYGNFINNLQGQNESGSSEQSSQENLPSDLDSVRRHRGY